MSEHDEDEPIDKALAGLGGVQLDGPRRELRNQRLKARLFGEDHAPPSRVGRFLVLGELGHGGMGTVLRAYDPTLHREVAIKLMHERLRADHEARLLREAQALARLDHRNVVRVYEAGSDDGRMFLAMELVEGIPLDQWQQQPRSWRECLDVYLQSGRGLAAAHREGLVHRDFKPTNCIIDQDQRVRVLDFGLAQQVGIDTNDSAELEASHDSGLEGSAATEPGGDASDAIDPLHQVLEQRLTATNEVMGTPAYLAPERLHHRPADALGDQFSFCVALYEALSSRLPFTDQPLPILLEMAEGKPHRPLSPPPDRSMPRWLQRSVWRGLSARPEDRWPSMDKLLSALERHRRRRTAMRRAAQVSAVSVAMVVAVVAAVPAQPPLDTPCQETAHQLDEIWGDERQRAVETAILATDRPYAAKTWKTIRLELDHYAKDWIEASIEACEATRVRNEQPLEALDLQTRCFRHRRAALRHDIDLLATADDQLVDEAVDLVARLPPIERCREIEILARSPKLDHETEAVLEELERIRSLDMIGRHDEALEAIEPLTKIDLEDGPLLAEVLELEGQLHASVGHDGLAEARLQRAYTMAVTQEADEVAVRSMAGLVQLMGVKRVRTDAALQLGFTAEALGERSWIDETLLAQVLSATAQVLTVRGEYPEARRRYSSAIEILEREQGAKHIALVDALDGQATAADAQGDLELAEESYRRALGIRRELQGRNHPATASLMTNLGVVLVHRGAHSEAVALYRQALDILVAAEESDHQRIAHTHASLGHALSEMGEYPDAEDQLRRAIDHWESADDTDPLGMVTTRFNLGVILKPRQPLAAIEQYQLARAILGREEATPKVISLKATILRNLGVIFAEQGRDTDADACYREALDILNNTAERDPITASLRNRLGGLLLERGDTKEAERLHREALAIYEADDPFRVNVGHTLRHLARALIAQGQWTAAQPALERALEIYAHAQSKPMPERVADAEQLLAGVLRHNGAHGKATQLERRARERLQ